MGNGFFHLPGLMAPAEITEAIEAARKLAEIAPFVEPRMPNGGKFHLRLTNCGPFGWWADEKGYRYIERHPTTGRLFPPIPAFLLQICMRALDKCSLPRMHVDNLLINHYGPFGSLGMHVDRTEEIKTAPIVSLSVGADAVFVMGGQMRTGGTEYVLQSGDCCVQSGPSRHHYHGIKRILPTMGNPLKDGGRLNFTFRQVVA